MKAKPPAAALPSGVEWIHECFPEGDRHLHVGVYLVRAPEGALLIDSGSFHHREQIAASVRRATGGRGIRALVLSHTDYPHSGNISPLRAEWGDFEIVASCADPEIQGLPYARRSRIGESLDVLGRRFRFLDPPLADRSHTTWVYDEEAEVLFVADGFGTLHAAGCCDRFWGELPEGDRAAGVAAFHEQTLRWLRFVDPRRLMGALRDLFEAHPAAAVAPIHGPPILREELEAYLENLEDAVRDIAGRTSTGMVGA